jgi:23S rRNA (adenine2503-C2)-methyltransferase
METLQVVRVVSRDGSRKYSFDAGCGLRMEAAFFCVPGRERPNIACVSTQLGCPFCAATRTGLFRNLTTDEILLQIASIVEDQDTGRIFEEGFEVSFMGTGEPLANLENLLGAVDAVHARYPRVTRVSVSTAGPARRIDALTDAMPAAVPVHLQISLHATTAEVRRRLIPNAPESMANLLAAGRRYHEKTGDQVFLNYVLLRGINDGAEDARWLADLDREAFYLKISALNEVAGMPADLVGATTEEIRAFSGQLRQYQTPHKLFVGDGLDVQASCGQLSAIPTEIYG